MSEKEQSGRLMEHENFLPQVDKETGFYRDEAGMEWAPIRYFKDYLKISSVGFTINARGIPFLIGRTASGKKCQLYPLEETTKRITLLTDLPHVDRETNIYQDSDGIPWAPLTYFIEKYNDFGIGKKAIKNLAVKLKIGSINGRDKAGQKVDFYKVKEFEVLLENTINSPQIESESSTYTDQEGEEWAPIRYFKENFDITRDIIQVNFQDVSQLSGRIKNGNPVTLYKISEALPIIEARSILPQVDKKTRIYTDSMGTRWASKRTVYEMSGVSEGVLDKMKVDTLNGLASRGKPIALYNLDRVLELAKDLSWLHEVDYEKKIYTDSEGIQWAPLSFYRDKFRVNDQTILFRIKENGLPIKEGKEKNGGIVSLYPVLELNSIMERFILLPQVDKDSGIYIDNLGQSWAVAYYFNQKLKGGSISIAYNKLLEEISYIAGKDKIGKEARLYNISEFEVKAAEFEKLPKVDESTGIYTDSEGIQWANAYYFSRKYSIGQNVVSGRIEGVPTIRVRGVKGIYNFYRLDDVVSKLKDFIEAPQVNEQTEIYVDNEGCQWAPTTYFSNISKLSSGFLRTKLKTIDYINGRVASGVLAKLYKVHDVIEHIKEFLDVVRLSEDDTYIDAEGVTWAPISYFADIFKIDYFTIQKKIGHLSFILGRRKKVTNIYKVEEVKQMLAEYISLPQVDITTGIYIDSESIQWAGIGYFMELTGLSHLGVFPRLHGLETLLGRGKNKMETKLYKITEVLEKLKISGILEKMDSSKKAREAKVLEDEVVKLVKEISENGSQDSQKFQSLLNIFGSSHAVDLLFKFRKDFKGLPVEYVKGIMGEYLGDTLAAPGKFNPDNIQYGIEYLSDATFKDALYENIKEYCLRYYFAQKQAGDITDSFEIIYSYIDHLSDILGDARTKDFDDVLERVIEYYDSALKHFHKPEGFVDHLTQDREFPDINQRINMKELKDKKRLLIADQMGLGKSASAIMAKEQLVVKCALVVAPSNVIDTWQKYLSDRPDGGYFKPGEAPRVLRVEEAKDLKGVSADDYDYILISHERMKENYIPLLKEIDYGMMVVDEMHKMKSLKGKRTEQLMELTEKIQGEDKYLALLSGTPVPNKIADLAISLKLLYPDKFADVENNELVQQIIHGDLIDLRSLLLPRMQMKSLEDTIEMPPLTQETVETELTGLEKEVYQVILEDDELTSLEKMQILMQYLLNPDLVDATPGIESTKVQEFENILEETFASKNKVLVFVNQYIEGVIRGEDDNFIFKKLKVPAGVEVRFVHGKNKDTRNEIQREFQEDDKKILLIVSGDVADVGVDYSAAEEVISYNPAWTKFKEQQQIARAHRYGLKHPLQYKRLVTNLTIEEGIYEYTERKYQAVQKLLKGIPISELEKQLLEKTESGGDDDLAVNPELAKYYFSSWDKLMRIFGYIKEIGEDKFKEFLVKHAEDYAEAYNDLGNRSYQANANRVSGTLFHEFMKAREPGGETPKILDIASGPEMLRQHIGDEYKDLVYSVDINKEHFVGRPDVKGVIGSVLALPFGDESFDYANLALSLHYTNFAPSRGNFERLQALMEMNRVLKVGGRGVLNIIYSLDFKDFGKFKELVAEAGFKVVEEYTGEAKLADRYQSFVVTLEKVSSLDKELKVEDLSEKLEREKRESLKFRQNDKRLKDSRHVVTEFSLGGKSMKTNLNEADRDLFVEEQEILLEGERLKRQYGKIQDIPREEVISHNFVRINTGKRYILFKRLTRGSGVVLVK